MYLFPYCNVNILETEACGLGLIRFFSMNLTQQHTKFSIVKLFNSAI